MGAMAEIPMLRSQPVYSISEAARYLSIPATTLRLWAGISRGKALPHSIVPLLELPLPDEPLLSFINLVEAHVLRVLRASHRVPLHKVRTALDYVHYQFGLAHPLARIEFQTDGVDLFVESIGRLINTSQSGQLTLHTTVQQLLDRVEVDESGVASRLYPLIPGAIQRPRPVVIDPKISEGRPVIADTGISTAYVYEQYQQGVAGLDAGADDYVVKPFSIEELLARVRAHLRRNEPQDAEMLQFDTLTLNRKTREVFRGDRGIELTAKEFDLLDYLIAHPRQVLTRDQILEEVWGYDFMGDSNIIEVYIRYLRLKLEAEGEKRLIQTVRGVGYVLRD